VGLLAVPAMSVRVFKVSWEAVLLHDVVYEQLLSLLLMEINDVMKLIKAEDNRAGNQAHSAYSSFVAKLL
jgi:hypothetical protein